MNAVAGRIDPNAILRVAEALQRCGRAEEVFGSAGLAHRIPKPVQVLLRLLPAPLATRVLLAAITRHAWTFTGSGEFEARPGRPVVLTIRRNPLCRGLASDTPACDYYAATFERLFRVLVQRDSVVTETRCEARGDRLCRFEIRW